jgi:hypothetical protein
MIFNQRTVQKLNEYTKDYSLIIYSRFFPDTIYLLNDDSINIDKYIKNSLNSRIFICYSKKIYYNNNRPENIQKLIPNAKIIAPNMLENIKNCFKGTDFVPDLDNKSTQKYIISNIDNYLTLHNKVKQNIEIIFSHIPNRHYAGAKGTKPRDDFEIDFSTTKDIVSSLTNAIKFNLEKIDSRNFQRDLFHEVVYDLRIFIKKFFDIQKRKELIDDISAPILIKNQKEHIIFLIVNKLLKDDLKMTSNNKEDAIRYFTNIYRVVKFNKLYEINKNKNLTIKHFKSMDNFKELESLIDTKSPNMKSGLTFELSQ